MIPLLLPIALIIGVLFFYYYGKELNASTPDAIVSVTVGNKAVPNNSLTTDQETVELTLKAKENDIIAIPYDETVSIKPLDEEGKETNYPQLMASDFKKSDAINYFDERISLQEEMTSKEASEETTEESSIKLSKELEEAHTRLPYYQVNKTESKGHFYFELEKDQTQRVQITRSTKKEQTVNIQSVKDSSRSQILVTFQALKEPLKQVEQPILPEELEEVEEAKLSEPEQPQPATEGSPVVEEVGEQLANESGTVDPKAVSKDTPFKVDVDVGKTTGLAPFDTANGPGFDKSADDDIVRTWDLVSYRVNLGISNIDDKYASLRIRLDSELPDAWRRDSANQSRQTAEIANGTVTDTASGVKKSTRSSWVTLEKATGQAYFTETIETFGGVNGDLLKPKFKVTIESAKLKNGSTETINQVIDGSVDPHLNDTVQISAKPFVDIKLAWTPSKIGRFEKVAGTPERPNTIVTNVASYAQIKPLPEHMGGKFLGTIKGSTYPVGGIEYEITQKQIYNANSASKELKIGVENDPVQAMFYDGLNAWEPNTIKMANGYEKYQSTFMPLSRQGLAAPVGYTRRTYPPTQSDSIHIGIFDTGNPTAENISSSHALKVINKDYQPASVGRNKWLLSGPKMGSNDEPFSVIAMQVTLPTDYLEAQAGTGALSVSLDYVLSVSKVKYEGKEQALSSSLRINWNKEWPGNAKTYSCFQNAAGRGLSSGPVSNRDYASMGDGMTTKGNKLRGAVYASVTDGRADTGVLYGRWNSNSFPYDDSRGITHTSNGVKFRKDYFGVGLATPDLSVRTPSQIEAAYTWYATPAEAKKHGKIAAIKSEFDVVDPSGYVLPRTFVPLAATGIIGAEDSSGNPNALLTNVFMYSKGALIRSYPSNHADLIYKPTKYSNAGIITSSQAPKQNWADTLYIAPMTIRPTITTNKSTYSPDETVQWIVDGKVESGSENNHKVQFEVTIPKETEYIVGTAKDYRGTSLSDPSTIVENSDGTKTLTWVLDYMAVGSTYNPKVTFGTSIVASKLTFVNNVANLNGKVVSELWLESDESNRDTSTKEQRTASKDIIVTNSGVIVVDKTVDKPFIESGNERDPAKPADTHPTDFTYTVSFKNHSAIPMQNVRVLDVLPYNGDQRGTTYQGTYSLTQAKQLSGTQGTIWYTNNFVAANIDPNAIVLSAGWYKLGSDMSVLKNAKAIMAVYDELEQGKDMAISLTLRPSGQKAGDKYINAPSLNSHLNKFVQGVPSGVRVYGRDLSGVAWYDDKLDGLIGTKPSGAPEEWAKDIPVKLYRSSLEVPTYKNNLVKESLTGEKFIDASGNSLKKTDTNGKYLFENLPEGDYIVEFIIGNKVIQREVRVTKKLVGSDPKLNSKADQDSYKTEAFNQPILSEVAGSGATDAKHHVTDVNLGLIRPSTIRLFKYATGTAIDANKDGHLSDVEKATGTPLKGAEFEVYEGNASTPFVTDTTDGSGNLSFVKLFPGEHTLIETKAPDGYELIKSPIKVTITEGNQTIQLYEEDDKKTELPFTGGTGPMFIIVMIVSVMGILGMGGLYWYYRQPSRKGEG